MEIIANGEYRNLKLSSLQDKEVIEGKVTGIMKRVTGTYGEMTRIRAEVAPHGEISFIVGGQSCGFIDGKKLMLIDAFDEVEVGDTIQLGMNLSEPNKQGRQFKNYNIGIDSTQRDTTPKAT